MVIYRHILGSVVNFRLVVNAKILDSAKIYIKKTNGDLVLGETDMIRQSDGVYVYGFATDDSMELTTYNAYAKISLNNHEVLSKEAFILIDN